MTYPALITDALRSFTSQTNSNDMGGRVVQILAEGDELLVVHGLNQVVYRHGRDKLLVADRGAIRHGDNLLGGVDLGNLTLLAKSLVLSGESLGDSDPDTTSAITGREAEGSVGAPVSGGLVQDDVLGHGLDVRCSDTLAEPRSLHLFSSLGHMRSRWV